MFGKSWGQEDKLVAPDGVAGDLFAKSVAVSGDTVVIGSDHDDDHGENSGSAYVFRFTGSSWIQETKLVASDGASGDYFGDAVSISGDTIELIEAFSSIVPFAAFRLSTRTISLLPLSDKYTFSPDVSVTRPFSDTIVPKL